MTRKSDGGGPRLRPGETIEVTVEKAVYRGQGLARHLGQVVFVPRALPGDRLRVRVQSVSSGYVRAAPLELVAPGSFRREMPCGHAATCGGCSYQAYDYDAQLRLKESVLRDALARAHAPWPGELPIHPSPERGWRTRAHLHLEPFAGGLHLGFHREGTHRVVALGSCLQLSEAMNAAALALRDALAASPRFAARVQGIELAESFAGPGLVAALHTDLDPAAASALSALRATVPALTGLGAFTGGERRRYLPLWGDPRVDAMVAGFHFRAHVEAFFQGNRFLTEPLARSVQASIAAGGPVLDLYAGAGLFALPVAARAPVVHAIEISSAAIADGRDNAARAGVDNVRFHEGDVATVLAALSREEGERVILDPPAAAPVRRWSPSSPADGPRPSSTSPAILPPWDAISPPSRPRATRCAVSLPSTCFPTPSTWRPSPSFPPCDGLRTARRRSHGGRRAA